MQEKRLAGIPPHQSLTELCLTPQLYAHLNGRLELTIVCRAEEVRALIEGNVKGMKKEAGQQLRDLQVHFRSISLMQQDQYASKTEPSAFCFYMPSKTRWQDKKGWFSSYLMGIPHKWIY